MTMIMTTISVSVHFLDLLLQLQHLFQYLLQLPKQTLLLYKCCDCSSFCICVSWSCKTKHQLHYLCSYPYVDRCFIMRYDFVDKDSDCADSIINVVIIMIYVIRWGQFHFWLFRQLPALLQLCSTCAHYQGWRSWCLGISSLPRSAVDDTVHAIATTVNDLAVQVLQLLQPLYLLIMILQRLRVKFIIFAAILSVPHKQWAEICGDWYPSRQWTPAAKDQIPAAATTVLAAALKVEAPIVATIVVSVSVQFLG